jgi:acyl-CoA reductase-like NAD-dependent aldehyde dehydrogenase
MRLISVKEIAVHNPGDGSMVGSVPIGSSEDVAAAVSRLREAQPAWEALGTKGRGVWLSRFRDWVLDHDAEIADVIQSETGRPRAEAEVDTAFVADLTNYWIAGAEKFLQDKHPTPHSLATRLKRLTVHYRPYPLVGVITPWNFPFYMPCLDAVPALAAGAAVVIKPSEVTPLSALLIARAWEEIGAPPVLAVLTGDGSTGAAVVESVDYVQFTGSTATGRRIAEVAARNLVPCSLELGGKDPALVLADADLDRAARGIAWGGLFNAGQACLSVERVYVEDAAYDEFVDRLVTIVNGLRQGLDDRSYGQDIGALANEKQVGIVERHVQDALAKGARAVAGGRRTGTGTFFEPTVLVDVDHSMLCMTEETFGPTIPVMRVADADEAVRLANDSPYGLSASVWTADRKRGEDVARRLEVGAVNVNDVLANISCLPVPHSGWKQSGIGARLGGATGIRKYCRTQAITAPTGPGLAHELVRYPYSAKKMGAIRSLARLMTARDLRRAVRRGTSDQRTD